MSEYYILRENVPVPVDGAEYERWLEATPVEELVLARDTIQGLSGGIQVLTQFLGIDQRDPAEESGPPEPYETLLSGAVPPEFVGRIYSYATDHQARAGHRARLEEIAARDHNLP